MNFASDNAAGVAPPILDAIVRANQGFALGYGQDPITRRLSTLLEEVFEREIAFFLLTTGTAANALALAQTAPSWGAVLCHEEAHLAIDECGAPEFFSSGLKVRGLPGRACKISTQTLEEALARGPWGGPHHAVPSVLSLTQATEAGTVYRPEEIRSLADMAHRHGLIVHMDGARLGNALARLVMSPADATWRSGVDVLSFGATKGGALAAEALILFDPSRAGGLPERRKRAGHLISKHRFVAAQLEAFLADGLWLELAGHANAMADRLARGLCAARIRLGWPVEANEVFAILPRPLDARLRAAGASYYEWSTLSLAPDVIVGPDDILVRMVASFSTTSEAVDQFLAIVADG